MTPQHCTSVVEQRGSGHAAALPFDPRAVFGRVRAPVRVTVGEHPPFHTTIASYGGTAWIGFRRAQLVEFGLSAGDSVTMRIEPDDGPREVQLPAELATVLAADDQAASAYQALSFTNRKEYAGWVAEAKQQSTRDRRAAAAVGLLREGRRSPH